MAVTALYLGTRILVKLAICNKHKIRLIIIIRSLVSEISPDMPLTKDNSQKTKPLTFLRIPYGEFDYH